MPRKPPDVRAPLQERSQQSLDRMLDAAEQLIRQGGIDGFTVADLVKRAESSVGSFYARFEDKEALVRVVQDRVMTRIEELLTSHAPRAWAGASLEECVLKFVSSMARRTEQGPLFHALLSQSTQDAVMRERGRRFVRTVRELFRNAVAPHRAQIGHENPELAIEFAYATCISVVERRLLWGSLAGSDELAGPVLVRELARSVSAYLRSAEPAREAGATKGKSAKPRRNPRQLR